MGTAVDISSSEILEKAFDVVISVIEHHSNIVPWQVLCEEKGAILPSRDEVDALIRGVQKVVEVLG